MTLSFCHQNNVNYWNLGYTQGYADATQNNSDYEVIYEYHYHEGNASTGGGCYATPIYHTHTGSASSGGGCYSTPLKCGGSVEMYKEYSSCYNGGGPWGTCSNWSSGGTVCGSHGCSITNGSVSCNCPFHYQCHSCGRNYGQSAPSGHKCTGINGYALGCGQSTSTIIGYKVSCGYTDGQIVGVHINFY